MKREDCSLMIFPFGYDVMKGTMTLQEVCELAARKGFGRVDVLGINESLKEVCRTAIDAAGVQVYCFIANLNFFQSREGIEADTRSLLATAKALDAQLFMVVPYCSDAQIAQALAMTKDAVRESMAAGFRLAVELGKEYDLKVCFETTPHDAFALSGTEDCLWMLDQVEGLGLVFDTANMLPHGEDTLESYEALKDRILYVHLKDVALRPMDPEQQTLEHTKDGQQMCGVVWGEGVIPVKEVAARLARDGYTGSYAVEYAHPGVFTTQAHEDQIDKFLKYLDL